MPKATKLKISLKKHKLTGIKYNINIAKMGHFCYHRDNLYQFVP